MFGKSKKIVNVAYKEKLLAEIAHYDKRIEEALSKRKQNSFEDESFGENVTNPYKFKVQPSRFELKQREANLSNRASMSLELAMLTVMQSEVNVMVTPPEVRKAVQEDGVWHEVAVECKIDLVSFTISFYAHKPHRKFAPTRFRNLAVALVKPAHQKELAQSILPKLQLPNLALQVLQSYATAFRSRRTTLLELAERYADKLKMQAMPEGGYRVRFLDLLQVDWSLENLWSPIVPFCHRMKFEVEYMPKDYISAIGKLYKQFKDPSLETSERTSILSKIFDICLQAAGPAREMQESFESDPETTGRLHERRTTIDQEPDVPNVGQSPKKPSGKENKPQNRKTDMAPPKTIPKKAKKSKDRNNETAESRKSVKRAIESDNRNDAKKSKIDDSDNSKSKAGLKGGSLVQDKSEMADGAKSKKRNEKQHVNTEKDLENNGQKKSLAKTMMKNVKDTAKATVDPEDDTAKKGDGNTVKSKTANNVKVVATKHTNKNKDEGSSKDSSEASSKASKKRVEKSNVKNVISKDTNTEGSAGSEIETDNRAKAHNDKTVSKNIVKQKEKAVIEKDNINPKESKDIIQNDIPISKNTVKSNKNKENTVSSKNTEGAGKTNDKNKEINAKKDDVNVESSKRVTNKADNIEDISKQIKNSASDVGTSKRATYTKDDNIEENVASKKVNDVETVSKASSKSVAKDKAVPRKNQDIEENGVSKKVTKNTDKDTNVGATVGKTGLERITTNVPKKPKENIPKTKEGKNSEVTNKHVTKANDKNTKVTGNPKVLEKNKVLKEKQTESAKVTTKGNPDKEMAQVGEKRKVIPKSTASSGKTEDKTKGDKTFTKSNDEADKNEVAKKRKTTESTKNVKVQEQTKKSTVNTESKNNAKESVNTRVLEEKTKGDETLQKAVVKNKVTQHTNGQNQKANMLNVTVTKSKIIPISKIPAEKQIKVADKLKTKIPMMKNKMTFSSLSNRMVNAGNNAEKTKIPQKTLPVFKKVAKNLPKRISPRKLPSFKPSSKGFLNK